MIKPSTSKTPAKVSPANIYKNCAPISIEGLIKDQQFIHTKIIGGKEYVAVTETEDDSNITEWLPLLDNSGYIAPKYKFSPFHTACFMIRDLLNCRQAGTKFLCYHIMFKSVFLCGAVVHKEMISNKYYVTLDDGTGTIECISPDKSELDYKAQAVESLKVKAHEEGFGTSGVLQELVDGLSEQSFLNVVSNLEFGELVYISGSLSQYNKQRVIFMNTIYKPCQRSWGNYIDDLLQTYETYYNVEN